MFVANAMGIAIIKEWFKQFKNVSTLVKCDLHSWRPHASRITVVVVIVENLTVREIAEEDGISKDFGHGILISTCAEWQQSLC